jgi:hypothetical protein
VEAFFNKNRVKNTPKNTQSLIWCGFQAVFDVAKNYHSSGKILPVEWQKNCHNKSNLVA